jgi:hypothetical protein
MTRQIIHLWQEHDVVEMVEKFGIMEGNQLRKDSQILYTKHCHGNHIPMALYRYLA